ncbi:glycosyltransferase [Pedobacter insulae]|uniref:Glycosyltransferase involved in cell wall bisynthesis n=1 Tax=Pedobacter insulae TaxID=414048 RepID=A0A1I2TBC6_9SPHI|nr:glycosyltransferase [Pedobacter insulae]SFG62172.1 Glycosyltransferase involved in cell wall bisynthesis [Pedobacter insulae]
MKVWIINPYGNIPGEGWRTYRTTLIADAFAAKGHEVISWVSNIQHRSKAKRAEGWKDVVVNPNYLIKIVPSTSYEGHISVARIKYERNYAKNIKNFVAQHTAEDLKPDLIILGEPALFIADIVLDIVKYTQAKLLVDVLDLWPELFHILLPNKLAFLGKVIFSPLYYRRDRLFKKANGVIAVAKDYLELALKANPALPHEVVYIGVDVQEVKALQGGTFESPILQQLTKQPHEIWVVYAGTLGPSYDIKTIIACAQILAVKAPFVKIIIAGDGPLHELVSQPRVNLVYVGSLHTQDVGLLYQQCDLALSSYVSGSTVSMPLKAYDYLAAGLPLVNSLGRDLGNFVRSKKIGLQYKAENALAMAEAIVTLVNDGDLRKQMSANALALAVDFDAGSQHKKVVSLAEKILSKS